MIRIASCSPSWLRQPAISSRRRELWKQFYYDVGGHAAAEEETFYSPLMEKEDGQPKGRHSVAEHKELDDIIQNWTRWI